MEKIFLQRSSWSRKHNQIRHSEQQPRWHMPTFTIEGGFPHTHTMKSYHFAMNSTCAPYNVLCILPETFHQRHIASSWRWQDFTVLGPRFPITVHNQEEWGVMCWALSCSSGLISAFIGQLHNKLWGTDFRTLKSCKVLNFLEKNTYVREMQEFLEVMAR